MELAVVTLGDAGGHAEVVFNHLARLDIPIRNGILERAFLEDNTSRKGSRFLRHGPEFFLRAVHAIARGTTVRMQQQKKCQY